MKVLVVDDEAVSRTATVQVLHEAGYAVVVAENGQEAWEKLLREQLQLVVCDWNMPTMNGLELCQAIRSHSLQRYIYVLMLTGHNRPEDTLQGLQAGADDYLTKPFNPAELVLRVNTGRRIICSESSNMTIFALAKLAESRDPETGAHLERVRSYCRVLAEELRKRPEWNGTIDDNFIRLIYATSPLHDIGKVAIPDAILLKPGKLTPAEFAIMKTHTTHGAKTLAAAMHEFPNAAFLQMAYEIAHYHHERYDGTGYPLGLIGESIPRVARIVALADVYDALTSKRVYKSAFDHSRATQILVAERGAHFDPQVVDAFLNVEGEFHRISEQFAEQPPESPRVDAGSGQFRTAGTEGSRSIANLVASTEKKELTHDFSPV